MHDVIYTFDYDTYDHCARKAAPERSNLIYHTIGARWRIYHFTHFGIIK